jgi:hypothetical protein
MLDKSEYSMGINPMRVISTGMIGNHLTLID